MFQLFITPSFATRGGNRGAGKHFLIPAPIKLKSEYKKKGKSVKYLAILKSYNLKFDSAARTHLRRNVTELMEAAPGKAWQTLKKMGAQPGECGGQGGFTLTEHLEQKTRRDSNPRHKTRHSQTSAFSWKNRPQTPH